MLVRTHKIPNEGLDLAFDLSAEEIRAGLPQGDDTVQIFGQDIKCDLRLEIDHDDVQVSGKANTQIHPPCSRCGEEFTAPLEANLMLICAPENQKKNPNVPNRDEEADEGLLFYKGGTIDLGEIVREQLLLSLPMRYLCSESCAGLCPSCGTNLNEGEHECKVQNQH